MELVSIFYIISIVLVVLYEIKRKKNNKIDILTVVNTWFTFVYLFIPLVTINDNFYVNDHFLKFIPTNSLDYGIAFLYTVLFYLSLVCSYNYRKNKTGRTQLVERRDIPWDKLSVTLILIALIGLVLFIQGYGGLNTVIANANTIRNGKFERNTFAAIARMFTSYSMVALLVTYYVFRTTKNHDSKIKAGVLLFLSGTLTLFSNMLSAGRGAFLAPVVLLFFMHVFISNKWNLRRLFIVLPFILFILLYGKFLFSNLDSGIDYIIDFIILDITSLKYLIKDLFENFTHPYFSLLAIMKSTYEGNGFLLLFRNVLFTLSFFAYLFGFPYQGTISHYNTEIILGTFDSTIPPGIIALGYYNFPTIGILFVALFFGYTIGFLESIFNRLKKNPTNVAFYLIICDAMSRFIFNGDVRVFIFQIFSLLILFMVILLTYYRVIRIRKNI